MREGECSCGKEGKNRIMPPAWYGMSLMPHTFDMIVCVDCAKVYDRLEAERAERPEYKEFLKSQGFKDGYFDRSRYK